MSSSVQTLPSITSCNKCCVQAIVGNTCAYSPGITSVSWSSSDTSIATVSGNGGNSAFAVVTGISGGTVTITVIVTTTDGIATTSYMRITIIQDQNYTVTFTAGAAVLKTTAFTCGGLTKGVELNRDVPVRSVPIPTEAGNCFTTFFIFPFIIFHSVNSFQQLLCAQSSS